MESFAPPASSARPRRPPPRWPRRLALAAAALAAVSLHRLGAADVCRTREAVAAVLLQRALAPGPPRWPFATGAAPRSQPPLFQWTAVALDRSAGIRRVTAWNLRLPAALYAIAGGVLTLACALDFFGCAVATLAGLILAGAGQYVANARLGGGATACAFCATLALCAFLWWYAPRAAPVEARAAPGGPSAAPRRGPNAMRYLLAAALGLGVLARGPIGALLPALAIAIFLCAERRPRELPRLATLGPVAVAVILGAGWYAAGLFGGRHGFPAGAMGGARFGRWFGARGARPAWDYLKSPLLNSVPFSMLAPFAVYAALRRAPDPAAAAPPAADPPRRPRQNPLSLLASLRMMCLPPLASPAAVDPAAAARQRAAVRLGAIFYLVTVGFFTVAADQRRAVLLPAWPILAIVIAWWLERLARRRSGGIPRAATLAVAAAMVAFNFCYLPRMEIRACADTSFRAAAAEINRVVGPAEPLYLYRFDGEPAPLLFYLQRPAPRIAGKLGDAPPGYVLVPRRLWRRLQSQALDLRPILTTTSGRPRLVLLRRGPAYAARPAAGQRGHG